jgi:hypothetical protein
MRYLTFILVALMFYMAAVVARAADTAVAAPASASQPAAQPTVSLSIVTDEGQNQVRATVKLNDRPLENAAIVFSVRRTFGNLVIGNDTTLDDGTAQTRFPQGLPGGAKGELQLLADVKSTDKYTAARGEMTIGGGVVVPPVTDPFPRAFWAPHAPFWLIASITVLLGGVWTTYLFVVTQVLAIRREGLG